MMRDLGLHVSYTLLDVFFLFLDQDTLYSTSTFITGEYTPVNITSAWMILMRNTTILTELYFIPDIM